MYNTNIKLSIKSVNISTGLFKAVNQPLTDQSGDTISILSLVKNEVIWYSLNYPQNAPGVIALIIFAALSIKQLFHFYKTRSTISSINDTKIHKQ